MLEIYKCINNKKSIRIGGDSMNNNLKTWRFAYDNDNQIKLVLEGMKTATTYLYDEKEVPNDNEEEILVFDNDKTACTTKTKKVIITEFKNIDENLSKLEGKENFETWKKSHIKHFKTINPNFNENTKVVFKIFEVKESLTEKRLELARKIAKANQDIFGNISKIEEVNAGFNNSIFDVNDTFIIKVCDNIEKEKLFDTEANFYNSNKDNNIPLLYKFDKSKSVIPYVYEIIEKVNGKTVYYHWYKMNEQEREMLIQKIVQVLQKIHHKTYPKYNWRDYIKDKIISSFNQTLDMFSKEEQSLILKSLDKYDEILSDNKFCLIHNDLHFDNILIDNNKNIKLIDFNDSIIAPFDYDLRLLYMSAETPWKWANIEMDPHQKPEDYKHLFEYIKKYYKELNNIKYLDERMLVYRILDDFKLLPRFREKEAKDRILLNSKKLLENLK